MGTPREKPYVEWTPELEAELNRLWVEEEQTAGQIAARFGFTRGQVIGKRNRLIAAKRWRGSVDVGRKKKPMLHPINPTPKPKPKKKVAVRNNSVPSRRHPPASKPEPAPAPKKKARRIPVSSYKPKTSFPWDENMFLCTKCMRRVKAHLFTGDDPFTCANCKTPNENKDGRRRR